MLVYGRNIFFNKVTPDNTFDKLGDQFNYVFLMFTVLLVIVATYFARLIAAKTKINKYFN